jgi:benzoyl-CoA reductase/2-hydroxyglutaryl-CoA dehydratase subunit BcrC/BadD/HgdB
MMRPKAMKYFYELGDNSFDEFEAAVAAGKKIVGIYCEYSPRELILAADAIPICLCGYNQSKIPPAEEILPRTLCPLIKSSFGYVVTESCPFFTASEFVIAETTCDGKKKMYEILQRWKPMFVLELTQKPDEETAFRHWLSEVKKLKEYIEERLQVEITDEKLKKAIKLMNEERTTLKELQECSKVHPVPMSGYDMSLVFGRVVDREIYMSHVRELLSELKDMIQKGEFVGQEGTKRIMLTGCPTGLGADKVIKITEECGAMIVCRESCTGIKSVDTLVDEEKPPLEAIAERYFKLPCSCMTPNEGRLELIDRLVEKFNIDGVIDLTWQACHTYNIESYLIAEHLEDKYNLPLLHIETDYSESDVEQLRVRIEAFLEMLR